MVRRKRQNSLPNAFGKLNFNDFSMFSNSKKGKANFVNPLSANSKRVGSFGVSFAAFDSRIAEVQHSRSDRARLLDSQRKAKIAKSPEQWLSAPNRYDLPGVDTPVRQGGFGARQVSMFKSKQQTSPSVIVPLKQKRINRISDTITSGGKQMNQKPTIIGKKTVLPTMEQIQKYVIIERKEAIKKDLTTQINKLARLNQSTPQQVIKEKRYALDDSKEIAEQTIRNIMAEARDERDTFTPEEKQIYKTWKTELRSKREDIVNKAVNTIFTELY